MKSQEDDPIKPFSDPIKPFFDPIYLFADPINWREENRALSFVWEAIRLDTGK